MQLHPFPNGRRMSAFPLNLEMCLLKLFDYRRFSSELKEALFHCTEEEAEAFPQICNAIFSNILHHGLGALGANTASCHKRSRSINKWLNHLSAYLKVHLKSPYRTTVQWATVNVLMCSLLQLMRALLLSAMHPPILTRSLVAVTVWHISTAQLIPVGFDISLISGYLLLPRNRLSLFSSH